jgi:hypothetical protein
MYSFFEGTGRTRGVPTGNLLKVTKKVTREHRVYRRLQEKKRKVRVQETKKETKKLEQLQKVL